MPRLEKLSEVLRQVLLSYPCLEHESAPWTPLGKLLSQCKLGLVTTAGLHLRADMPFVGGDISYRVIPSDSRGNEIVQSHASIGFDHTGIYRDINVTFPIDRLRELVERGVVGSLARSYYSFMGALRDPRRLIEETVPEVAGRLVAEGVDVVLITPT